MQNTNIETMKHILTLRTILAQCIQELIARGNAHDVSKMHTPEIDLFVEYTPKLKDVEYNSAEYKEFLLGLKPALDHHYANNSHHPEHYADGVNGMDLFDLLEMMCDWKASSMRGRNGDLNKSLDMNIDRFAISPQLAAVLRNTIPKLESFTTEANVQFLYPQGK